MAATPTTAGQPRGARPAIHRAGGRAAPALLTAALAVAGAWNAFPLPMVGAPLRLLLVVLALAIGIALTVALDRPGPRPYWQMALATTLILMPILALQSSASRVPFVSISRGSAGPLLWLTLAAAAALFGLWLFAVYQSDQAPENGALLFLPAALLVPAVLGAPGDLDETSALSTLAQTALVSALAIFVGFLAPPNWRPFAGGVALGAQFLLLWVLGRGPTLAHEGGAVVPICAAFLLAVASLLAVVAPLGALFSRRFFQTVDESGAARPASVPAKGARRPNGE